MPQEIERKYLVRSDAWRSGATGKRYRQGYLSTEPDRTVRVRVAGDAAFLTVKGRSAGAARAEYEYTIPREHAEEMLDRLCLRPLVEKTRYRIPWGGLTWEVDEFGGANAGLVVAEVELAREDQAIELPPWVGREVTQDPRYANASLVARPYATWRDPGGGVS
jgi:CYTH domain-containing protein